MLKRCDNRNEWKVSADLADDQVYVVSCLVMCVGREYKKRAFYYSHSHFAINKRLKARARSFMETKKSLGLICTAQSQPAIVLNK